MILESHPDASFRVSSQLAFRFRRTSDKTDFQDGGYLSYLIPMILAIFYHRNASCQVSSQFKPFGSEEEAKNRFSIGMILAIFDLQIILMLPTKFQVS